MSKIKFSSTKLIFALFCFSFFFSCNSDDTNNETPLASIIGTWKIVSLTSNGIEELQDELVPLDGCAWEETYTETTLVETYYSGANCQTTLVYDPVSYTITNMILNEEDSDPVEIIELTNTTLKLQDSYVEEGTTYVDIYTYQKQQ